MEGAVILEDSENSHYDEVGFSQLEVYAKTKGVGFNQAIDNSIILDASENPYYDGNKISQLEVTLILEYSTMAF